MKKMKSLNSSNILIIGGAGFVGSNLCKYLINNKLPKKIIIVDNLLSSEIDSIPISSKVQFIPGSITDDKVINQIPKNINFIFHLACYHGNQSSIQNPIADHQNNTFSTLKLFDYFHKNQSIQKVVYSSAGCSVAEKTFKDAKPTYEDSPASLFHDSPYSISKIIGEMYGNYYWKRFNFPFVKARFQNVYGPGEILGAGIWRGTINTIWRNVIPTFIWKSLNGDPLILENNGNTSRDFIFIDDIVRGLILCAERGLPGEVYNLATEVETKIKDLAKIINNLNGNKSKLKIQPPRNWDNSGLRFGSTKKSFLKLNFKSKISLNIGLKKTIEWTIKNKELIKKNILKHKIMLKGNKSF